MNVTVEALKGGVVLLLAVLAVGVVALPGNASTGPGSVAVATGTGGDAGVGTVGGPGPTPTDATSLLIDGSTSCYASGEPCTFSLTSLDPSIFFYRWDLNGDGAWDWPSQVGSGPLGKWTVEAQVTVSPGNVFYDPAALTVCAQGCDGASTNLIGDVVSPDGPIVCTGTFANAQVRVRPGSWSEDSRGAWVKVSLRLYPTADPAKIDVASLALEGLAPAMMEEGSDHLGGMGGAQYVLWFDRLAVTEKLGPGTHAVHLTGVWGDGLLGGTATVTING